MRIHHRGVSVESPEEWLRIASGRRVSLSPLSPAPNPVLRDLIRAWWPDTRGPTAPEELSALVEGLPGFEAATITEVEISPRLTLDDLPDPAWEADLAVCVEGSEGRSVSVVVLPMADGPLGERVSAVLTEAARGLEREEPGHGFERIRALAAATLLPISRDAPGEPPLRRLGELRLPLLAGVAGARHRALREGAGAALFVVHELIDLDRTREARRRNNREEIDHFVRRLTGGVVTHLRRGEVAGPLPLPGGGPVSPDPDLWIGKVRREWRG